MHILLLGATGRTGIQVLQECLRRNHTVTALVRSQAPLEGAIPAGHPGLTTVWGTPLDSSDVAAALAASPSPVEAVITTLNPRRASDSPFAAADPGCSPPRMMASSMAGLLEVLGDGGRPVRIVALSALGAGSSARHTSWPLRLLFRHSNMRYTYEDHDAVEEVLVRHHRQQQRGAVASYVLVRPTRLVEGEEEEGGAGARVFDETGGGTVGMMETISRGAAARFLVDAAESGDWDGKAPIIVG